MSSEFVFISRRQPKGFPQSRAALAQVHTATLHNGRRVAMKIQYPGVARSIESDVDNLMRVISLANILPKGLYVEAAAKVGLTCGLPSSCAFGCWGLPP